MDIHSDRQGVILGRWRSLILQKTLQQEGQFAAMEKKTSAEVAECVRYEYGS